MPRWTFKQHSNILLYEQTIMYSQRPTLPSLRSLDLLPTKNSNEPSSVCFSYSPIPPAAHRTRSIHAPNTPTSGSSPSHPRRPRAPHHPPLPRATRLALSHARWRTPTPSYTWHLFPQAQKSVRRPSSSLARPCSNSVTLSVQ